MACAWKLLHIGERLTGGAGETQEQGNAPREAGHWMRRARGRELAEMLWPLLMFGEEVTQMSPPIRKPWTCEGSRGNSGQEGSGGKGGVETWPRDVTCSSLSRRAPLFVGFVPSGRKSQRRVKQVEGVFTFSQFLLF